MSKGNHEISREIWKMVTYKGIALCVCPSSNKRPGPTRIVSSLQQHKKSTLDFSFQRRQQHSRVRDNRTTMAPVTRSSDQKSKRQERREKRELLRARAIGAVGKISLDGNSSSSKKIVFDDEEDGFASESNSVNKQQTQENKPNINQEGDTSDDEPEEDVTSSRKNVIHNNDDESDDSDSDVEEVKTSSQTLELLQKQEEAAKEAAKALSKKKKKKKKIVETKKVPKDDEETSDLDESFFQQLQKERQETKAQEAKIPKKTLNTRTTFILEEESDNSPIEVGNGIQVVALEAENDAGPSSLGLYEATPTAVHHSKSTLIQDSSDTVKGNNKRDSRPNRNQPSWERSSRMKRLLVAPGSFGNKRRRGMAAAFFTRK